MYFASLLVDEVMVPVDIRIKDHCAFLDRLHPDQTLFHKQVECVVHSGSRDCRTGLAGGQEYIVGGRMCIAGQHTFNNGDPLWSGLDVTLPQDRDGIVHLISICIDLDNVKVGQSCHY